MPYAHFFSILASNIESIIAHGGYVILFLLAIVEGIPVLGMAVPGHISIIVAGFLSRIGTLNLAWVMVVASVGAVLGDFIGYSIGRKYGLSFIDRLRPSFGGIDKHIEMARGLLDRHAGKFMIIGRFNPATRALLPFLVGSSGMPASRFWFFNIIGGLSWVISSVLLGYVFGAGYHVIAGYTGRLVMIFLITAALIIWGYKFVSAKFHIFRRYEIFTLILNLLALWGLVSVVEALSEASFQLNFNMAVNGWMARLHSSAPFFSDLARIVTVAGGTEVMIALGVISGLFFLYRKRWRSAAVMILSIFSTGAALGFLKNFFNVSRPDNALMLIVNDPSFPSGHAGLSAAFFLALAYLVTPRIRSYSWRGLMILGSVLAMFLIGISRIVLNVHWASDVIAGWCLGIFMTTGVILVVRYIGGLFYKK